jgi:hypothetical protein
MRTLRKSTLLVSEFLSDAPKLILSATLPRDEAYVVTLHLRQRPKGAMAAEGRWIDPENFHSGNAGIVDLRMKLTSEYAGPFHYLTLYLNRAALEEHGLGLSIDGARQTDDRGRIGQLAAISCYGTAARATKYLPPEQS